MCECPEHNSDAEHEIALSDYARQMRVVYEVEAEQMVENIERWANQDEPVLVGE